MSPLAQKEWDDWIKSEELKHDRWNYRWCGEMIKLLTKIKKDSLKYDPEFDELLERNIKICTAERTALVAKYQKSPATTSKRSQRSLVE